MALRMNPRTRNVETALTPGPPEAVGWRWQNAGFKDRLLPARDGRPVMKATLRPSPRRRPLADGPENGRAEGLSKRPAGRLARGLAAVLGLGALLLAGGFLVFVSTIERAERRPGGRADGIVALTGGAQRVGDAIDLLASGYGRRLLISGVNERTSRDEIARLNPSQRHWIDCCVDLDYRARNTIGNAIETRRWMRRNGFGTVAVVTSNYHMPRTLVEIGHALGDGQSVVPYAVIPEGLDVARWWADPPAVRLLGAEYVKFLAAWLRTRFEGDPEQSRFAVLIGRGKPVKTPLRLVAEPHENATD